MNAYRRRKLEGARVVVSRGMAANGVAVGCGQAIAGSDDRINGGETPCDRDAWSVDVGEGRPLRP
jgi:hypothetical protein